MSYQNSGKFVYECLDKNGQQLFPGMFAEFVTETKQTDNYGRVTKKKVRKCSRISEVHFSKNGATVKIGGRTVDPSCVVAVKMTDLEAELAYVYAEKKVSVSFEQIREDARMLYAAASTQRQSTDSDETDLIGIAPTNLLLEDDAETPDDAQ